MNSGYATRGDNPMSKKVREIQGYAVVVDKIVFITRVFEAEEGEGYQFNIRFGEDLRLSPRFPSRHEAELERELLLEAIRTS